MSTGQEIIEASLEKLGAHSVIKPANDEDITRGWRALNDMMEYWLSKGIKLGVSPLETPGDSLNEPGGTRNAIINNLAIELEGGFNNGRDVLSPSERNQARVQFRTIKRQYGKLTIPNPVVSSTLPVGAGNQVGRWENTFFGEGAELDN